MDKALIYALNILLGDNIMITVDCNKLLLEKSKILYDKPFSEDSLHSDWEITGGEWWVEDGVLNGRFRGNGGGLIYSKENYPGDIMLDFYGRTVAPCNNDLNFTWCAAGWDYERNDADISYIAGLQGWWEGKAGIERYPQCALSSKTEIFQYTPGEFYHIQAGIVKGVSFIFVNGKLVIDLRDPDPIDSKKYGKIGFGTYCSFNQYKNFKLYRLASEKASFTYTPNF